MAEVFTEPPRAPNALLEQLRPVATAIAAAVATGLLGLAGLAALVLAAKGFVWLVRF